MNYSILNVNEKAFFDNSIVNAEKHTHQPYASTSLNNNDEIRIPIQQQDTYTLPWGSSLYIEGKLVKGGEGKIEKTKLVNNAIAFLFDEIRYEFGGIVIDRVRNPGITTTIKSYTSMNQNESIRMENAGWSADKEPDIVDKNTGNFNVCIPLRFLMGFCEDFKKIVLNLRQELILIRSNNDTNSIINTTDTDENVKIQLSKVLWKMPHISAADVERLRLINYVAENRELDVPFRSWELHEYPLLQETQRHSWAVKTATQIEKPRFVIIGFQTNRKNNLQSDASKFDHCNLANIRLFLNSEIYPYDNLNLNFANNQWANLYEMYAQFQESYYERENQPLFSPKSFKDTAPLAVIDCSHQNEVLKTGAVDIRLEFETTANIPGNTAAYCLILHDRLIKYNPLTSAVRII